MSANLVDRSLPSSEVVVCCFHYVFLHQTYIFRHKTFVAVKLESVESVGTFVFVIQSSSESVGTLCSEGL